MRELYMMSVDTPLPAAQVESLSGRYRRVRSMTLALCEPLEAEDYVAQSMPDASPIKWHLAHTSWFFEQFILRPRDPAYRPFKAQFDYLFNSYYQTVGPMHLRPQRGLLTRPTVAEVRQYRAHVDEHMQQLIESTVVQQSVADLITLGLHHEQQHQELMLTDLKHLFSCNPLLPAYREASAPSGPSRTDPSRFIAFDGGIVEIGALDNDLSDGFCFDNELPRHRVLLEPFALADRLVTNEEYLEFVRDGGYRRAEYWLSDGWSTVGEQGWSRPMYWSEDLDSEFTLAGLQSLNPAAPVCHLSYYEADAYARWSGARLPTEAEWESATPDVPVAGNLLADARESPLHPQPTTATSGLRQLYGDVWEWTASSYSAYPGYRAPSGAIGEYNGKFMCNQLVLRGGSCVTPADHVRATYRNFFYPQARWQFMGLRLARDL
ncbi:MAG TPA: ergothioneine biosynthesis protein EgtB [Povalibacter sp.]